jgi:hypothetical protein
MYSGERQATFRRKKMSLSSGSKSEPSKKLVFERQQTLNIINYLYVTFTQISGRGWGLNIRTEEEVEQFNGMHFKMKVYKLYSLSIPYFY